MIILTNELTFDFLTTPNIIFGNGKFQLIDEHIKQFGSNVLLVASENALKNEHSKRKIDEIIGDKKIIVETFLIKGEPDVEQIDDGVKFGLEKKSEVLLAIGGGSSIDAGKAISGLITNGGSVREYLEGIGNGKKITKPALPLIAIPTTAGTGSEATKNAVILSKRDKQKASIRSHLLVPKIALIDPALMITVPKDVRVRCGLDALTQLIEAYTSNKATILTDELALLGIKRFQTAIHGLFDDEINIETQTELAFAALLSGICLTNAGLGAVHGFAGVIGGMLNVPHGVICGALLPHVLRANVETMLKQFPLPSSLKKYATIGNLFRAFEYENIKEAVKNFVIYLEDLIEKLNVPKLSKYGLYDEIFNEIIERTKKTSSMKYNPIELTEDTLYRILKSVA